MSAEEINSPLKNVFGKSTRSKASKSALCIRNSRSVSLLFEEFIQCRVQLRFRIGPWPRPPPRPARIGG